MQPLQAPTHKKLIIAVNRGIAFVLKVITAPCHSDCLRL